MVIIKKYGNRRLYDTSDSKYVTLAEIAAKIRAGFEVRLLDAKSNEDLTPQMLTQILFEDRNSARLLPVSLLTQLVRMGDDAVVEFFGRYVTWALDLYLQARQGLAAVPHNPLAAALSPLNPFAALLAGAGRPEPLARPAAQPPTVSDDLAALRREVEDLKKSLRKPRR